MTRTGAVAFDGLDLDKMRAVFRVKLDAVGDLNVFTYHVSIAIRRQGADDPRAETMPVWDWDGNEDAPTLNPSVLHRSSDYCAHFYLRAGVIAPCGDQTLRVGD